MKPQRDAFISVLSKPIPASLFSQTSLPRSLSATNTHVLARAPRRGWSSGRRGSGQAEERYRGSSLGRRGGTQTPAECGGEQGQRQAPGPALLQGPCQHHSVLTTALQGHATAIPCHQRGGVPFPGHTEAVAWVTFPKRPSGGQGLGGQVVG